MHSTRCTVQDAQYKMHSTRCTVQDAQYKMHSTRCTVQDAQYKMHSTRCTVQDAQYKMHGTRCTVQDALTIHGTNIAVNEVLWFPTLHRVSHVHTVSRAGSEARLRNTSRVQLWPYSSAALPDLTDRTAGLVAEEAVVYNDSSISFTRDWGVLAILLRGQCAPPSPSRLLGVLSLLKTPQTLGVPLHTASVEGEIVSLSFSPTGEHLLLGFATSSKTSHPFSPTFQVVDLEPCGRVSILRTVNTVPALWTIPTGPRHWPMSVQRVGLNCCVWLCPRGDTIVVGTSNGEAAKTPGEVCKLLKARASRSGVYKALQRLKERSSALPKVLLLEALRECCPP
ncbi:hypothetical protein FHG87_022578 [Trinorchestia longiramus]|nr:hypothetical protein FHG87_022578 [Trinorchestia longiramus]